MADLTRYAMQGGLARPNNVDEENLVEKGPGAPLDETTSFIAEKKAALEVVKRRLGTRGVTVPLPVDLTGVPFGLKRPAIGHSP